MKYYFLGIVLLLFGVSCKEKQEEKQQVAPLEPEIVKIYEYGFDVSEFFIEKDTVQKNQSFGEIMLNHRVSYPTIYRIAEEFKDTFDVRRIRVGKPYTVFKSKDSLEQARILVYENTKEHYTVFDMRDSLKVYRKSKPLSIKERMVTGSIETSLSESLDDQGVDFRVTYLLSDIYAWSIDFFRLQKGDRYKVVFEERYINDTIYDGIQQVKHVYFEHRDKPFYAFRYETDSVTKAYDYYDEEANTLRKAFLKAPVKFSGVRISSRYNLRRRIKYYGYKVRPHRGTDYAAPIGTPIVSTANGVVEKAAYTRGNGKYVKIKHNGTYSTQYLHMQRRNVRVGQYVRQGDVIGWIGMTGNTGGPHVCYRFWKNGVQVDPLKEELPSAEPIDSTLKDDYLKHVKEKRAILDSLQFPELPKIEENLITDRT
ncbi:MAG: peptidoglycan DD-metalloendopeptidase family protein [Flavobacteriaceae bacterium]|nr:peptidoglycan DD-metalloendopeptidase family protein [Flavobacteriaceae bacterium]